MEPVDVKKLLSVIESTRDRGMIVVLLTNGMTLIFQQENKSRLNHEKKRLGDQPLESTGAGNGIRTRDFNLGKVALYL